MWQPSVAFAYLSLSLLALNQAKEVLQRAWNDTTQIMVNVVVLVLWTNHGVRLATARLAAWK